MKNQNLKPKTVSPFLIFSYRFSIFSFLFSLLGCGSGSIVEQVSPTPSPSPPGEESLNLSPQENVYVAAALFSDPVGSIATVGLNNPYTIQKAKAVTDSTDVVLKSFDEKLFVINRGVVSTIQVIDPSTMKTIGNYSVGAGSNPQDLVVANGKAFISRLDAHLDKNNVADVVVVNPLSGALLTNIHLISFTDNDGERLARAAQMALVGNILYVLVQDLSNDFKATTNGKVVLINTITNTLMDADSQTEGIQAILLKGRNPTDIVYSASLNRLFVTNTGVFDSFHNNDPNTSFGGIEVMDVSTNKTLGILIDDADFGGYVSTVRLVSDSLGVVTIRATVVAAFNPKTLTILNKNLYSSPSGFIPELLADKNGLLWIPERDPKNAGVLLIDPSTAASITGPLAVGSLPASMTLIH